MGTASLCPGCIQRDHRIAELEKSIARLQAEVARLQTENERLRAQLKEAQRAGKRQAAPFSKGPPKEHRKSTARPRGANYGKRGQRAIFPDDQIDEFLDAPLPDCCPDCGGSITEDVDVDVQYQEEIPIQPIRRKITIHQGTCRDCGRRVRGRHPTQTSAAVGAAASQLGPNAQATIDYLNKHGGMSYGKIAKLFEQTYGIHVTRSACAQIVLRAGRKLQPAYEEIQEHVRHAEHITPDETGWRLGGRPAWLHGWVADDGASCFVIDPRRSAKVLQEVIGRAWEGSMTHDGYASYNKRLEDAVHQQCLHHVLRRAQAMVENAKGRAKDFPRQVIDLFKEGLHQRDEFAAGRINEEERLRAHEDLTQRLAELSFRPRLNEDNERLAKHLYKHTGEWFMFLADPSIPATNYRAEQVLRLPIGNRKVSGGNRTHAGRHAQGVNSSVIATCAKRGVNIIGYISNALCGFVGSLFSKPAKA